MPESWRKIGIGAVVVLLLAFTYEPLAHARLLGEDFSVLAAVRDAGFRFSAHYDVPGVGARPLAGLSLALSIFGFREAGLWSGAEAWLLRGENLLWLFVAALGLYQALVRAVRPWMGTDQARSAGFAAAMLLLVHPLAVHAVIRVASRGDLIGLALATWAVHLFLRGRQDKRPGSVALAALLTTVAGFCSVVGSFIPPALAGMEYISARRHRPRATRLRTANNTLFVFAACAAIEWIGRATRRSWTIAVTAFQVESPLALDDTTLDRVGLGFEKLGVMILPVSEFGLGKVGYIAAAICILLALHPALVAARSAPRLWARVLLGWLISVVAAQLPNADLRVEPGILSNAHTLLSAALVMAIGLGVASTALSGLRRTFLPGAVVLTYAVLGHANAGPWRAASDMVHELQERLVDVSRAQAWSRHILILDPPVANAGNEVVRASVPYLLDPMFFADSAEARPTHAVWVRSIVAPALRALSREPEFERLRGAGLTLLVPAHYVSDAGEQGVRVAVDLSRPSPSTGRSIWRSSGESPSGTELDAATTRAVVVAAMPGASTEELPEVRWRASAERHAEGAAQGVWLSTPDGPVASFDLNGELDWLFGDRIRSLWFSGSLTTVVSVEALERATEFGPHVVPRPTGSDWQFDLSDVDFPQPLSTQAALVLGLLDVETMTYAELPVEPLGGGLFVGRGALERVDNAQRTVGGPVAWFLDYRVEGQTVARARGRRLQLRESLTGQ